MTQKFRNQHKKVILSSFSYLLSLGIIVASNCYNPSTGDSSADSSSSTEKTSTDSINTETSTEGNSNSEGSESMSTSGGTSETSGTSTGNENVLPQAPELNLAFSAIKQFTFSWEAVERADYYQLQERIHPEDAYTMIENNIVNTSIALTMPLHLRFGASYIVSACNENGCTDSTPVEVVDSLASAIGYFKASNTNKDDNFGETVELSADGNTLVVSSIMEASESTGLGGNQNDNSAPQAGAVYVFVREGNAWSQQAYLKASNAEAGDRFGVSLSLSSDGNTLAVGAYLEDSGSMGINKDQQDNSVDGAGAVYVFTRKEAVWAQQAYIKASNAGNTDFFGESVHLSADGNTLAVGASKEWSNATGINGDHEDNSANGAGAVYIFIRTGTAWSQQAYIKASNTNAGDYFGIRTRLSADGNTLAVGALWEDSGNVGEQDDESAIDAGAVYVFVREGNVWSQQAYLKASNIGAKDEFGYNLALSSDGNTLAVGAPLEDSGTLLNQNDNTVMDAGAVYIFIREGNIWSQQAYLKASNAGADDRFGRGLALSKDGHVLAVGAYGEDSAATGVGGDQKNKSAGASGAAYIFTRKENIWSQKSYIKPSDIDSGRFGYEVTLSEDANILAVGAYGESSAATGIGGKQDNQSAPSAGAVYLY